MHKNIEQNAKIAATVENETNPNLQFATGESIVSTFYGGQQQHVSEKSSIRLG